MNLGEGIYEVLTINVSHFAYFYGGPIGTQSFFLKEKLALRTHI